MKTIYVILAALALVGILSNIKQEKTFNLTTFAVETRYCFVECTK